MQLHAEWCEQFRNSAITLSREWGVVAREEEINLASATIGAQLADQFRERAGGWALQLDEIRVECAQAGSELHNALAQKPGAVRAGTGTGNKAGLPDEDWEKWCAALLRCRRSCNKGGMISEPNVSTEPEDHGRL